MPDDLIPIVELMELVAKSVACASSASENLRYDFLDLRQRVCVGLLQAVIDYGRAIHAIVDKQIYYPTATLNRAALDAFVDIKIAFEKPEYCERLELADALPWMRVLEKASEGKNPLLAAIAQSESFAEGRRMYAKRIKALEREGVKLPGQEERYDLAEMSHEYDAAYKMLSAEAHNNLSFITQHYFDAHAEPPALRPRGSRPGNGAPAATLIVMAEIVLTSTDMVLRVCGHGTAILRPARDQLDSIRARASDANTGSDIETQTA